MEVEHQVDVLESSVNSSLERSSSLASSTTNLLSSGYTSRKFPQFLAAFVVSIGAFSVGNVAAWSAPASRELQLNYKFTLSEVSWISSIVVLGTGFSVLPTGYMTDKFGRKLTIIVLVFPLSGGWIITSWAKSWEIFCVGRFITGMACGAYTIAAPIYLCEIAEKGLRETLGTYFQLMINVGVLFVYVLGREANLFWMTIICSLVPVIFGMVFSFMPETPVYYMHVGREDKAKKSLLWLQGPNCDIEQELLQIGRNAESDSRTDLPPSDTIKIAFFISVGVMSFQQLSGINAVIFYTTDIFHFSGISIEPSICTIIVGAMQVFAALATSLLVDRLGCRVLLLISSFVMCICMYALGIFFYLQDKNGLQYVTPLEWLPLVSICLYVTVFSFGFGPVPWMLMGVLFPRHVRGLAISVTCFIATFLGFMIAKFFADLIDSVGLAHTFWLFSLLTAVGSVFIFFVVPETRGKTLEEVQLQLSSGN